MHVSEGPRSRLAENRDSEGTWLLVIGGLENIHEASTARPAHRKQHRVNVHAVVLEVKQHNEDFNDQQLSLATSLSSPPPASPPPGKHSPLSCFSC